MLANGRLNKATRSWYTSTMPEASIASYDVFPATCSFIMSVCAASYTFLGKNLNGKY